MQTDDLITLLSRQPGSEWRPPRWRWRIALAAAVVAAFGLMWLTVGMRDRAQAPFDTVAFGFKIGLCLATLSAAFALVRRRSVPGHRDGPWPWAIALLLAVLAATAVTTWWPADPMARQALWQSDTIGQCLLMIPLFALPAGLLLGWAARLEANTSPTASGAAIGLAAGAIGALAYAMHCPMDNPVYLLCWYVPALLISTGMGRLLGARLLRW